MFRQRLFVISLLSTAMFAGALLYYFFPAGENNFYPGCFSYRQFHVLCPSCGAQRSLSSLLQGKIFLAFRYNLLLPVSLPILALAFYRYVRNTFLAEKQSLFPFAQPAIPWIVLSVILLYTILRNVPAYPFCLMAP